MKENAVKFAHSANRFIESDYFILVNALIVLIGWAFDIWAPMLCVMFAINIIPLFFFKDTKHLLSALLMFTLIIRTNRHKLDGYTWLLVLVAILFIAIAFSLIRFRRDFRPLVPTRIKGFHCSLIALIIPFALAGAGSPTDNAYGILASLALVVVFALGYSFFVVTNQDRPDKEKLIEYVIKTLFVMGGIMCVQMIIFFAEAGDVETFINICVNKAVDIGWAGPNNVAPTLAMAIPATLYLCIRKNKATPILVAFAMLEYFFIICTGCRGAILLTTFSMIPMLLYVVVKSQNKLLFGASITAIIFIGVVLIAFYGDKVSVVLSATLNKGLESVGRSDALWPEAIETFKRWPIFGSGWDYKLGGFTSDSYTPYFYHSTILQIMATMGICGMIGFAFFYFFRYRSFVELRKNPAVLALLMSTLFFDGYGMVDTGFFGPTFFVMLLVLTFVVEINLPDNKCRAFAGRNPFKDIAYLAKTCFIKIKEKTNKQAYIANSQCNEQSADSNAEEHGAEQCDIVVDTRSVSNNNIQSADEHCVQNEDNTQIVYNNDNPNMDKAHEIDANSSQNSDALHDEGNSDTKNCKEA